MSELAEVKLSLVSEQPSDAEPSDVGSPKPNYCMRYFICAIISLFVYSPFLISSVVILVRDWSAVPSECSLILQTVVQATALMTLECAVLVCLRCLRPPRLPNTSIRRYSCCQGTILFMLVIAWAAGKFLFLLFCKYTMDDSQCISQLKSVTPQLVSILYMHFWLVAGPFIAIIVIGVCNMLRR